MNSIIKAIQEKDLFDKLSDSNSFAKALTLYTEYGYYHNYSHTSYNKIDENGEYISVADMSMLKFPLIQTLYHYEKIQDLHEAIQYFKKFNKFCIRKDGAIIWTTHLEFEIKEIALISF